MSEKIRKIIDYLKFLIRPEYEHDRVVRKHLKTDFWGNTIVKEPFNYMSSPHEEEYVVWVTNTSDNIIYS